MSKTQKQSSEPKKQAAVADPVAGEAVAMAMSEQAPVSGPTPEGKVLRKPRATNQRGRVGGGGSPA